jgi:predicted nucleic acid-binding protein
VSRFDEPYLVDTSVWIEYLRGTGSAGHRELRHLLHHETDRVTVTEPVTMEILSGETSPAALAQVEMLLGGLRRISFDAASDFHSAAAIYRAARTAGITVRTLLDCLIAAVAIRTDLTLLHRDRDYEHLADVIPQLRTRSLR